AHIKPKDHIELVFIEKKKLNSIKQNDVRFETKTFCYVPVRNSIYIKYMDSQSQITPAEFVRELDEACLKNGINELYFVMTKRNNVFVEKLLNEEARENLLSSKIKRKEIYDRNMNPVVYKPNDLILVKNEVGNKLNCVYSGPYVVIKDMSPNVEIMRNNKPDYILSSRSFHFAPLRIPYSSTESGNVYGI
ncbi:hypothetical protein SFRURICE_018430, partial [Spodoptera frugiperda]